MRDRSFYSQTVSFKLVGEWDICRRDELRTMLMSGESADEVLLDVSEMAFMDASVLGSLMRLRDRMTQRNRQAVIRIVGASGHLIRVFEICKLQRHFDLAPSINAVLLDARFAKPAAAPGRGAFTAVPFQE